ncbi:TonB-dependent receptor [Candidatus Pelagibacter bacterium]|nr:TonB-dependent receptor [Candidatus Pelagibacter bacterium]
MKFFYLTLIISLTLISFNKLVSADIPTIVISAGKTPQSLSTVGTNVTVISGETIRNSNEIFLGNIIDGSTSGTNLFQQGGDGTLMGIQLRGLEKRYSTVYINGVKMSDPSTPDNSFYFQNIMKDSIDRVEILKGNQSSLYGANAIGGTIHIFTKKGKEGHRSNVSVEGGSNNSKSAYYSVDGANDKIDYYLGLNRFLTSGISARNDDGESDQYRNESLNGSFGYKFNESLRIENSLGYTNTDLKYDAVSTSSTDLVDRSDDILANYSLRVIHDGAKTNNILSYSKLYSERDTTQTAGTKQGYFGFRDAINYTGTYNFSLDNRVVYGAEAEFEEARMDVDYFLAASPYSQLYFDKRADEHIFSQFFDYQFRPLEKLYATVGFRSDEHSSIGREPSGRTTLAYKLDNVSTIRSSLGTGVRFPAIYDLHFSGATAAGGGGSTSGDGYAGLNSDNFGHERGNSFDVGYETYLDRLDLNTNITYFYLEQKNGLTSDSRNNFKLNKTHGVNTSKGIELGLDWKPDGKKYGVDFDYTYTKSYDNNTCKAGGCHRKSSELGTAKVQVPQNAFSSNIIHNTLPGLTNSVQIKFVDEVRSFGDGNNSFKDVILEDYTTINLRSNYRLYDTYDLSFNAKNIFDDNYEQVHGYSSMGRSFNFGIKRVY